MRRNPAAGPTEIKIGLRQAGVKVSTGLISNVKHHFKKQAAAPSVRVAARKMRAVTTSARANSLTVEQLFLVRQFVDTLGGPIHVRAALETLDQLR